MVEGSEVPQGPVPVTPPGGMTREDVKSVATYQKVILLCILALLLAYVVMVAVPVELKPLFALPLFGIKCAATVFVFLLALKLYSTALGIVFGILTLLPCVGLIVLLIINAKATATLRANGIKVGLLGARWSDL
jgi:hypothetical protein